MHSLCDASMILVVTSPFDCDTHGRQRRLAETTKRAGHDTNRHVNQHWLAAGADGLSKQALQLARSGGACAAHAKALSQTDKVRIQQLTPKDAAVELLHLRPADVAIGLIVENHRHQTDAMLAGRR